jgi:iron(III) transport system substrate-binding protein
MGSNKTLALTWIAAVTACGLVLTSCGSGSDTADPQPAGDAGAGAAVFDKFNAMSGQERQDALVEAAKQEGKVVFYTALEQMNAVADGFTAKYGIPVELFFAKSNTVMQRLMQEAEAGHHQVDVFEDSEAYTVAEQGMAYEYVNAAVTDGVTGYDPAMPVVPTRLSMYTQGWNTDMVPENEIPDTIEGFTDEKWRGNLSLDPRDWIWYSGLVDYYPANGKTEEDVDKMMATLASYATLNEGHTVNAELLAAGEFPATLSVYTDSVEAKVRENSEVPIAWRKSNRDYITPLIYQPQGAVLMKNAPHPAAGMLFMDFLLTEGQRILSDTGIASSVVQPGGALEGVADEDLFQVDYEKFTKGREEWTDRFNSLLQTN